MGTVIISTTANDNSNISDTISIDVNALDIIISPATLSVDEGGTGFYTVVLLKKVLPKINLFNN